MTVLFFARLFYPHIGGVEKHVFEISTRLKEKGFRVIVVTENYDKKLKLFEEYKGLEIYRIPVRKSLKLKKFIIWHWLWKHKSLIKTADIVHCHDVTFWFFPFRLIYPQKPIFTTFHGYESYPVKKRAIVVRKISELLSWGNICIGDFMKKWYFARPNFISYGGIDLKNTKYQILNTKYKNSAVFIGRLDDQTGIQTYVEAVKIIRKKVPNFKFTVLGGGGLRRKIEKDVKVLGFKENINDFLQDNRFAFVSRYLSILEAMAVKRLAFAIYDNPIKKEYLKNTPFAKNIILSSSSEELAEKVLFFINNPKKEKALVDSAFEWVKDQTWDKFVETYLNLWYKRSD